MRVLIAANQGADPASFERGGAVDGELVVPVLVSCTEPDRCPCQRAWAGVVTGGFSTLAEVAERPHLGRAALRRSIHDLLDRVGWVDDLVQAVEAGECHFDGLEVHDPVWAVEQMVDDHVAQLDEVCRNFPVGALVSRLGDLVAEAVEPQAA